MNDFFIIKTKTKPKLKLNLKNKISLNNTLQIKTKSITK